MLQGITYWPNLPAWWMRLQCSVEIQQELKTRRTPSCLRTAGWSFGSVINLGDVIEEGEQIYGDGVNIAARLEGLAEAGGI